MDTLLHFTFTDLIAFFIPAFIGLIIFTKRRKRHQDTANYLLACFFIAIGSFCEVFDTIYTTYSYRHNELYNNDRFTTVFNYDFSNIIFFAIVMTVAVVLFFQELRLRKSVR